MTLLLLAATTCKPYPSVSSAANIDGRPGDDMTGATAGPDLQPGGSGGETVFSRITAEGGKVQYDITVDAGNGWYSEPASPYMFKLAFKQGLRTSATPILVGTLQTTHAEHFEGASALQLQIDAHTEPDTAHYKVAIGSVKPGDPFSPSVLTPRDWYHGFAMKIDSTYYQLPSGPQEATIFEQFHQGSPFHPPIALVLVNAADAAARGWPGGGADGHFGLMLIDDDHGPLDTLPGTPQYYDLGPVIKGQWLRWVIRVRPSPSTPNGAVTIYLNGAPVLDLGHIKVGYDPSNPQYGKHAPTSYFDYVDTLIYRANGANFQRIFFDDIRFFARQ
jgi:hypothetical protein